MPAVSQKQQIAMNLAKAIQKGEATATPGSPSAQIAQSMKPSDLTDFTGPVDKGLPQRITPPPPQSGPPIKNVNVGGPGPGRPSPKVKKVGKTVKKARIR